MQLRYICKNKRLKTTLCIVDKKKRLSMPTFYINFYSICKNKAAFKTTQIPVFKVIPARWGPQDPSGRQHSGEWCIPVPGVQPGLLKAARDPGV